MNISNKSELDAAIIKLERKKIEQQRLLVDQFKSVKASLTPMNLLKSGFNNIRENTNLRHDILNTAAGLGIGALSKKLFLGSSPSFIKKLLSGVVELAVAKTTISNADKVKAFGISIYNNLFKKNSNHKDLSETHGRKYNT